MPNQSGRVDLEVWDEERLPSWLPDWLPYLRLSVRVVFAFVFSFAWAGLSIYIAIPWVDDLGESITEPLAILVIGGIAIVPGYLNAQLVSSLLFDSPPRLVLGKELPAITLMIAAYNEEEAIAETLRYASQQRYPGTFEIVVIDDGSTDGTVEAVECFATENPSVHIRLVAAEHSGKAAALNAGLGTVTTELIATIDADTLLMEGALVRAVSRLVQSPPDTFAVAGSVLVRNSRDNLLTRMQEWDYLLGIASIKRTQGLVRGTLVAQGAFSVYRTGPTRIVGGWSNVIGEDIVLTWAMPNAGGRTTYEPTAVSYTDVPTDMRHLGRQRQRWARGMIEGLRAFGGPLVRKLRLYSHSVAIDWVFPYVDLVFTFAMPIGIVLALMGNFALIGPMTIAIIPLNAGIASIMYIRQRAVLRDVNLKPRRNLPGFVLYFLFYQFIVSPVSVSGYFKEITRRKARW